MSDIYISLQMFERGHKKEKNKKLDELIQEPINSMKTKDILKKYFG